MAKIVKLTGYLVLPDTEDDYECDNRVDPNAIAEILNGFCDAITLNFNTDIRDVGEWDDNCALNYRNCPTSECEKWFT